MKTIPGESLAKIWPKLNQGFQRACSQGEPKKGNMNRLNNGFPRISFSNKSISSTIFSTFSPRATISRYVKTFSSVEWLNKSSEQWSNCDPPNPGKYHLGRFGFLLQTFTRETSGQHGVNSDV